MMREFFIKPTFCNTPGFIQRNSGVSRQKPKVKNAFIWFVDQNAVPQ
jgi:hypothetical protein